MSLTVIGCVSSETHKAYANKIGVIEDEADSWSNYGIRMEDGVYLSVYAKCVKFAEVNLDGIPLKDVHKVFEFADSLRKQDPPTTDNKYIWVEEADKDVYEEPLLFRRTSFGKYTAAEGNYVLLYNPINISKWRPATVS